MQILIKLKVVFWKTKWSGRYFRKYKRNEKSNKITNEDKWYHSNANIQERWSLTQNVKLESLEGTENFLIFISKEIERPNRQRIDVITD